MKQPLFFYKFVSFDRTDILKNGMIRFAPIGSFNDPFELEPSITPYSTKFLNFIREMPEAEIDKITMTESDYAYSADRADKIDHYRKMYREKIGQYGVLSLSSNDSINQMLTVSMPDRKDPRTNILMWSHYADSHKGFVIEFEANFIEGIKLEKVEYSESRDSLTFEDVEEKNFDRVFFKKSPEWQYEQEYRAVSLLSDASRIDDGMFHLFKIDKTKINSITFGCAMSEINKKTITDLVKSDPELKGVKLEHAKLAEEGFYLSFYYDDGGLTNNSEFGPRTIPGQLKL